MIIIFLNQLNMFFLYTFYKQQIHFSFTKNMTQDKVDVCVLSKETRCYTLTGNKNAINTNLLLHN